MPLNSAKLEVVALLSTLAIFLVLLVGLSWLEDEVKEMAYEQIKSGHWTPADWRSVVSACEFSSCGLTLVFGGYFAKISNKIHRHLESLLG